MDTNDPRFRVSASRRMLYRQGCDSGVAGHVSVRDEDGDGFYVSAFGYFDETTPDSVLHLTYDLKPKDGTDAPASPAVAFHAAMYQARADVGSVIHTHSHWSMVFCTTNKVIGQYNDPACLLLDEQVIYKEDGVTPPVYGPKMAETLGDKSVLHIQNHGALIVRPTLEEATVMTMVVEKMAQMHIESEAVGGTEHVRAYSERSKAPHYKYYIPQTWEANLRRLRKTDPELFMFLDQPVRV